MSSRDTRNSTPGQWRDSVCDATGIGGAGEFASSADILKASEKSLFYAGGSSTGSSSIIVRRLASGDLLERFVLSRKLIIRQQTKTRLSAA
jgi:hypothetical protein